MGSWRHKRDEGCPRSLRVSRTHVPIECEDRVRAPATTLCILCNEATHLVVLRLVEAVRDLGASDLRATVGPSVCGRCYEVPAEMRDDAERREPVSVGRTSWGTPSIDVAAGVVEQLSRLGVSLREWVRGCTLEDEDLFSYRRDGSTGRLAGAVRLVPPTSGGLS